MKRFWEIIPGALAWTTLIGFFLLSWKLPAVVVFIIILYDLYWLLKVVYLFSHLRPSFMKMRGNMKIDWLQKIKEEKAGAWENIRHLVIFPVANEPYDVVRSAFLNVLEANYPKEKFFMVLAMEERRGEESRKIAERIEKEFGGSFGKFLATFHPADLPEEMIGKGSNEVWAAKEAKKNIIDPSGIRYESVIASVFDIDTRTGPDYFGILTHTFLSAPHPQRSSYQPIPIYTNNIHEAPFFARLIGFSSTFWQIMQEARPEQLVSFSSHSIPWKALTEVGFWETDLVSEDSRIFFQCLAYYKGDWRAEPIFYPIYLDAVTGKNVFTAVKNLYKQQRRWAWGAENLARLAQDFSADKSIPKKVRRFWFLVLFDGFYSWSTSSFIIFFFGWMPNVLGSDVFHTSVLSYNLPRITGWMLNLGSMGVLASAFLSIVILAPTMKGLKKREYLVHILQWVLTPVVFIFFSALPALDAQTRLMLSGRFRLGFWNTPKEKAA